MSRSNYDKPFYVDVGTSIVAIRCASNHDVVSRIDHHGRNGSIKLMEENCDRMNREVELSLGNAAAMYEALVWVKRLFDGRLMWQPDIHKAHEAVNAALAAPPRNCDVYTHDEALRIWAAEKENDENGCFDEWLYAPAERKGKAE